MARIPYYDKATAPENVREELDRLGPIGELNLTRILAHADIAFLYYVGFAGSLLTHTQLDVRLRELAILLVAAHCDARYEWDQHAPIAKAVGVADEQIEAIERRELDADCLPPDARAVLRFVAQVLTAPRADDDAFALLAEHSSPREIVELLLVVGHYQMIARVMTTLDIDSDEPFGEKAVAVAEQRLS